MGPHLLFCVDDRKVTDRASELYRVDGIGEVGMFLLEMISKIGGIVKFDRAISLHTDQRVFFEPGMVMAGWSADALHHVVDSTGEVIKGMQHCEQTGS